MTNPGKPQLTTIAPVYAAVYLAGVETVALPVIALDGSTPCVLDDMGRVKHVRNYDGGRLHAVLPIAEANAMILRRDREADEAQPSPPGAVDHPPVLLATYAA